MELVSETYKSYFLTYGANGSGGRIPPPPCPILGKNSLPGIGLNVRVAFFFTEVPCQERRHWVEWQTAFWGVTENEKKKKS